MIQAERAKSKHKITQRTTNSIFLHKYFWKSPFVELLNRLNAYTNVEENIQHKEGEPIEHKSKYKQKITNNTQATMTNMKMCVC